VRIAECGRGKARHAIAAIGILLVVAAASASYALDSSPVVTTASVTAPAATPPDAVAAIEAHYRDLVDLTAKVIQKNFLKSVDKTQTFDGSLAIKKPGKLRLEYTNGQTIVIDGKEAWFYSKKSAQAIRRTFKDFEQANIPVAFLLGAGAIRQDFDVSVPEAGKPGTLDLVPKRPGAAMKKLRLHADDTGRITQMIIFDRSGNTSDIRFSEVKEGLGLDDQQFRFKVPKGTEVIEQ
jgi:outer membrane lipoprotein carrier protein